jgi:hypothetical protein
MKRLLIAGALVLSLAGCNISDGHARWLWATPDAGTIHNHSYTPESWQYVSGSTSCSGTPTRCTTDPGHMQYSPPSWSLDLYAKDGDHGWTSVDERAYNMCHDSQYYPDCAR